jgi:hypothetical protein
MSTTGEIVDGLCNTVLWSDELNAREANLLRTAASRLSELERENAVLKEACRQAAITFRFYEQSHLAKKTQEGDEKAHRNHEMAAMCEAALAGSGEK